jgi:hypothetical protein
MAQRSFKLSDELDARLVAVAAACDRPLSWVIVKAVEREVMYAEVDRDINEAQDSPARRKLLKDMGVEGLRPGQQATVPVFKKKSEPVEGTPLPKIAPRRQPTAARPNKVRLANVDEL